MSIVHGSDLDPKLEPVLQILPQILENLLQNQRLENEGTTFLFLFVGIQSQWQVAQQIPALEGSHLGRDAAGFGRLSPGLQSHPGNYDRHSVHPPGCRRHSCNIIFVNISNKHVTIYPTKI